MSWQSSFSSVGTCLCRHGVPDFQTCEWKCLARSSSSAFMTLRTGECVAPFRELGLTGRGLVLTGPHATKDPSHGLHPEAECGRRFIHDSLTASQSRPSSVTVKDNCKVQWISKKQIEKNVRFLSLWTFFPLFRFRPRPRLPTATCPSFEALNEVHNMFTKFSHKVCTFL